MIVFDLWAVSAIALKTSLLVVVLGLIAVLMARQSAAWRHFLWTSALVLSLLLPIATVCLPSGVHVSLPWEIVEPWGRDETALVAAGAGHVDTEVVPVGALEYERSIATRSSQTAWTTAMIAWAIGAMVVVLRHVLGHVGLIRWVRKSRRDLSPAWAATLRQTVNRAGFPRRVRVLESDHTTSPCTFGFVRPVVLLPAAGACWPKAQRRFTLLHELAHVRRLDYLTTQVANLACAVHWYNPIVWYAAIQARKLQEQASDDAVLAAGGMPSDYAQFLVELAGSPLRPSPAFPAAVGMVQRSQLHGRVTAILDESRARLPVGGLALVAALAPLAGLTLLLATLSVAATPLAMRHGIPMAASFNSVELRNGGKVHLVHGQSQGVTLLKGDAEQASITIREDGRLVIDRCPTRCPSNHDFEVSVAAPALAAIRVAEGGTIQARGGFPPQPAIGVAVSQGGAIDIRSMQVANVTATVYSGGRIFTRPGTALAADVEQGGNITYWGDAIVNSSIRYGGVIVRGEAADAERALAELMGPQFVEPIAPIPPVPPVSPIVRPTG